MTAHDEGDGSGADSFDDIVLPWARRDDKHEQQQPQQQQQHDEEQMREEESGCGEYVRATSLADGREVRLRLRAPFTPDDAAAALQDALGARADDAPHTAWVRETLARCTAEDARREAEAAAAAAAAQAAKEVAAESNSSSATTDGAAPHSFTSKYAPRTYGDLLTDEALNREVLRWLVAWRTGRVGDEHRCPVVVLAGPPGTGKTTLAHVLARQAGYDVVELNASDVRAGAAFERAVADAVSFASVLGSAAARRPNLLLIDEIDGIAATTTDGAGTERGPAHVLAAMVEATLRARRTTRRTRASRPARRHTGSDNEGDDDDENDDDEEKEEQEEGNGPATTGAAGAAGGRRRAGRGGTAAAVTRRTRGATVVRHPIICTCNDLYVPALRPLRRAATVVAVHRPGAARFLQILRRVCAAEHIAASASALTALCELSGYDMRSALNTLEFVARAVAPGTLVTPATVQRAAAGAKDVAAAARDVWARLLFPPESSSSSSSTTSATASASATTTSASGTDGASLLAAVEATGEPERVLEGCWLNYATLPAAQHDAGLQRCVACADALSQLDAGAGVLQTRGSAAPQQHRALGDALWGLACLAYKVHGTDRCAAAGPLLGAPGVLAYPACHAAMWRHRQALLSVAESFADALPPRARQGLLGLLPLRRRVAPPAAALEDELLPHLAAVLRPRVRPVARALLRPAEQHALAAAAAVMDALGLAHRTATDPPPAHLVLDPFVFLFPPLPLFFIISGHHCLTRSVCALCVLANKQKKRPVEDLLCYGGRAVDEALGHTDAFFQRQQRQHEMYGTPLTHTRTPTFTGARAEQSDAQRRLVQGELEHLRQQRAQARLRAHAPAAPVIRVLEDLIPAAPAAAQPPPKKTRRDFFGRTIPVSSSDGHNSSGSSGGGGATGEHKDTRKQLFVKYKHQEGFTNAVKRKLTMAYFL